MPLSFQPLFELNFKEIASLFNRCFEDYVVPVNVTAEYKADRCRRDGTDLKRSFVTLRDGDPVAIAFTAPWPPMVRLAGMGVVKEARGQGVGRITLDEFIRRARSERFGEAVLEVFEQNLPALALYKSFGFEPSQRLLGFKRDPTSPGASAILQQAPASDYLAYLRDLDEKLPSIHTAEQIAMITPPNICWTTNGEAFVRFAIPEVGKAVIVSSFAVRKESRGKGKGRQLFDAIQAAHPTSPIFLPQIFPEALSGFLTHIGFERLPLNQFEMRLALL